MSAAARFPVIMPQLRTVTRIERPGMIGRRHVKNAVDLEHAALDLPAGDVDLARALPANLRDDAAASAEGIEAALPARLKVHLGRPGERQLPYRFLVDLRQRAVPLAGVIAGIGRPVSGQIVQQHGRIDNDTVLG